MGRHSPFFLLQRTAACFEGEDEQIFKFTSQQQMGKALEDLMARERLKVRPGFLRRSRLFHLPERTLFPSVDSEKARP